MGYALASAALQAGHQVVLISAPTALKPPKRAKTVSVQTSQEMFEAVRTYFNACDCLIMAAAVSDWRPKKTASAKIKKSVRQLVLHLVPTPDILAWAGQHKKAHQRLVGFALEDRDLLANAEKKRVAKRADIIVANSPQAIGSAVSTVYIKGQTGDWQVLRQKSKTQIAKKIVQLVEKLFEKT